MDKTIKWTPLRNGLGMEVVVVDNDSETEVFRVELIGWGNGFGFKMEDGQTVFMHADSQTVTVTSADDPEKDAKSFAKYLEGLPALSSIPEKDAVEELIRMFGWQEGEQD